LPILKVGDALLVSVRNAREAIDALKDLRNQNLVLLQQRLVPQMRFLVPLMRFLIPLMRFLILELHPRDDLDGLRQSLVPLDDAIHSFVKAHQLIV
jgi:hypothetical protein